MHCVNTMNFRSWDDRSCKNCGTEDGFTGECDHEDVCYNCGICIWCNKTDGIYYYKDIAIKHLEDHPNLIQGCKIVWTGSQNYRTGSDNYEDKCLCCTSFRDNILPMLEPDFSLEELDLWNEEWEKKSSVEETKLLKRKLFDLLCDAFDHSFKIIWNDGDDIDSSDDENDDDWSGDESSHPSDTESMKGSPHKCPCKDCRAL